jgi:hypothetical protein
MFLSSEINGKLIADKNHSMLWEEFLLIKTDSLYIIRSYDNKFLTIDDENKLVRIDNFPGINGLFSILDSAGKSFITSITGNLRVSLSDSLIYSSLNNKFHINEVEIIHR